MGLNRPLLPVTRNDSLNGTYDQNCKLIRQVAPAAAALPLRPHFTLSVVAIASLNFKSLIQSEYRIYWRYRDEIEFVICMLLNLRCVVTLSSNILCILPVTVARPSDDVVVRYVLPVLQMTCFHIMGPSGGRTDTALCSSSAPVDVAAGRVTGCCSTLALWLNRQACWGVWAWPGVGCLAAEVTRLLPGTVVRVSLCASC